MGCWWFGGACGVIHGGAVVPLRQRVHVGNCFVDVDVSCTFKYERTEISMGQNTESDT